MQTCPENVKKIENCIADVRNWMIESRLKLNDAQTEFIFLGNSRQVGLLGLLGFIMFKFVLPPVSPVHQARNIGVIFDYAMSLENPFFKLC